MQDIPPLEDFITPILGPEGVSALRVQVQHHGKRIGRTFDCVECGGEPRARQLAEEYRDRLLHKVPLLFSEDARKRLSERNTSGYPGVCRINSKGIGYWRASTRIHGYNLTRSFRIDRHGEVRARQLAIRERERHLALCSETYEVVAEKLQRIFSQSGSRLRESRINQALLQGRQTDEVTRIPAREPACDQVLRISRAQARLSIIRHLAASAK